MELSKREPAPTVGNLDSSKLPMAPWEARTDYYGGEVSILERYEWDQSVPSWVGSVPGFAPQHVNHMRVTFVELHTGEIQDVHEHYFASGPVLEKIRVDFKQYVMSCWHMARKIYSGFPHHTIVDLPKLLDPQRDNQARYFNASDYARICPSRLKSYALSAIVKGATEKRNSSFTAEMFYGMSGDLEGLDCHIERRNDLYEMRARRSPDGGVYVSSIKLGKRANCTLSWSTMFEAKSYRKYVEAMVDRDLTVKPKSKKSSNGLKDAQRNSQSPVRKQHVWTPDDERFLTDHPEMTHRQIAEKLGVSTKAVERKLASLRKKGALR